MGAGWGSARFRVLMLYLGVFRLHVVPGVWGRIWIGGCGALHGGDDTGLCAPT